MSAMGKTYGGTVSDADDMARASKTSSEHGGLWILAIIGGLGALLLLSPAHTSRRGYGPSYKEAKERDFDKFRASKENRKLMRSVGLNPSKMRRK